MHCRKLAQAGIVVARAMRVSCPDEVLVVGLRLADGSCWSIVPGDQAGQCVAQALAEAMCLSMGQVCGTRILVALGRPGAGRGGRSHLIGPRRSAAHGLVAELSLATQDPDMVALQLMKLSLVVARDVESRGGLLLHGGLAERGGLGAALAGPAGAGKTVASRRLSPPWQSLSDDATLVVRGREGQYWAHPWPTWSRFMFGGPGGSWDVQHKVALRGIFFLVHADTDSVRPLEKVRSIGLLMRSAQEAHGHDGRPESSHAIRAEHLQRFENVCALTRAVPCYRLGLTLEGAFWNEVEPLVHANAQSCCETVPQNAG